MARSVLIPNVLHPTGSMITPLEFEKWPMTVLSNSNDSQIFILSIFFTQSQINYVVLIPNGVIQEISNAITTQEEGQK